MAIDGFAGDTAIDCRTAGVTISVVLPDIAPNAAAIPTVPAVAPLARPVTFTVATVVLSEDQVTDVVIFCDVPSE